MNNYLRLLEFLRPYVWPHFLVATICMLGYGATDGALPFVVQWMMDDVFVKKNVTNLYYVPLAVIGIFLIRGILNFGHSYLSDYVGLRIVQDVRNRLARHLQYMSLSFFSRHPSGTLISRVSSDVTLLRFALTDALVSLLKDSTSLIVLVTVAFMMDGFWHRSHSWSFRLPSCRSCGSAGR